MAILLGDAGLIEGESRFQNRVAGAMQIAAAAVYTETAFAAVTVAASVGSKVLTFAAVPNWVGTGGGVVDLTTSGVIPNNAILVGVSTTTVTLSAALTGSGVSSGDVILFTQHSARANFANRVASNNYNLQAACFVVLGNPTIAGEAVSATQPDNAIPDADIQFAVNSNWNLLAGA